MGQRTTRGNFRRIIMKVVLFTVFEREKYLYTKVFANMKLAEMTLARYKYDYPNFTVEIKTKKITKKIKGE